MKVITLDFSQVDNKDAAELVALAIALGATVSMPSDPTLYPISVPEGATIASVAEGVSKSDYCKENLTDEKFRIELPRGPIKGNFYSMGGDFESEDAVRAIEDLAKQKNKKFRVGTPLELLLFFEQSRSVCPKYFMALGTTWNGQVLCFHGVCTEFDLRDWAGKWLERYQVFFVEDLEPSSIESKICIKP